MANMQQKSQRHTSRRFVLALARYHEKMSLTKSKKRVADHGEVFTPRWLVDDMLNLVHDEAERIDSRFLEAFNPTWIQNGGTVALAA